MFASMKKLLMYNGWNEEEKLKLMSMNEESLN